PAFPEARFEKTVLVPPIRTHAAQPNVERGTRWPEFQPGGGTKTVFSNRASGNAGVRLEGWCLSRETTGAVQVLARREIYHRHADAMAGAHQPRSPQRNPARSAVPATTPVMAAATPALSADAGSARRHADGHKPARRTGCGRLRRKGRF